MRFRWVLYGNFTLLACLMLLSGCGETGSNTQVAVKGKITLDGEPLDQGRIVFEPSDPSKGQPAAAVITKGVFDIPEQNGVAVGSNLVRITSNKPTGKKVKSAMSNDMLDEMAEAIPEQYNMKSTLNQDIVPGENNLTFELKRSAK